MTIGLLLIRLWLENKHHQPVPIIGAVQPHLGGLFQTSTTLANMTDAGQGPPPTLQMLLVAHGALPIGLGSGRPSPPINGWQSLWSAASAAPAFGAASSCSTWKCLWTSRFASSAARTNSCTAPGVPPPVFQPKLTSGAHHQPSPPPAFNPVYQTGLSQPPGPPLPGSGYGMPVHQALYLLLHQAT
jgi:hypothetical protein